MANEPAAPATPAATPAEPATPATPAAPAATATPATPAAPAAPVSLLASAKPGEPATPATPSEHDWMPEKFRVVDAEGKLDEAASSRKLADSYKALEAHKGPMPSAPATPEDYKIEPMKDAEGKPVLDPEILGDFTADPAFKEFANGAHAVGMTNEQMQYVVDRYLTLAPELIAENKKLTADEASVELSALWKDETLFNSSLLGAGKAIEGFGGEADDMPGSRKRLSEKFGSDPDFLAFAARISKEMKEDTLPGAIVPNAADADIESMQKSEAYWKPAHPDHKRVKAKVDEFYARQHGTAPRR